MKKYLFSIIIFLCAYISSYCMEYITKENEATTKKPSFYLPLKIIYPKAHKVGYEKLIITPYILTNCYGRYDQINQYLISNKDISLKQLIRSGQHSAR